MGWNRECERGMGETGRGMGLSRLSVSAGTASFWGAMWRKAHLRRDDELRGGAVLSHAMRSEPGWMATRMERRVRRCVGEGRERRGNDVGHAG